jgi:hypothetical protein
MSGGVASAAFSLIIAAALLIGAIGFCLKFRFKLLLRDTHTRSSNPPNFASKEA